MFVVVLDRLVDVDMAMRPNDGRIVAVHVVSVIMRSEAAVEAERSDRSSRSVRRPFTTV